MPTTAAPDDKPEETAEKAAYRADEIVRVSIFLEGDSTIDAGYSIEGIGTNKRAIAYREKLEKQQDKMAAKISKEVLSGKELDVVWNLTLITNLISARVRYGDIEKIAKIKGVKEVVIEPVFQLTEEDTQPNMVNARDMTGSNGTNATKYQGAGSKLAIIDTGLDLEHQSFNEDAFLHAVGEYDTEVDLLTAEEVAAVWDQLNFAKQHSNYSAAGSYYNAKIPFIANYVDGNQDVTHLNDKQEEHGSHVAGIATANRYLKIDDQYVDAAETVGVVGQAPDAQIFVMKVFGSNGGASPTDYMAGVEDALILGADSVNLSLGSSNPGTTFDTSYTNIIEKLVKSGMVVCISAGNNTSWDVQKQLYADDINYHTGGSPGSFTYSFGVASVDDSGTATPYIVFDGTLESRYNEMPSDNPKALFTSLAGTYEYVYIDTVGNAAEFDALADQLAGKIVMCNRGTITFAEKANNSAAAGAAGTIIVNNQAGAMTGVSMGSDYQYSIPVIGILQSVGQDLKNQAEAHLSSSTGLSFNYYTGTIKIGSAGDLKPLDYYSMSSFSAWGVPGSLILKPEITTPGGSVMSLNGYHQNASGGGYSGGHDEYELMSGTSMAAPQVTGLVAAIAQYYREENIAERTGLTLRQFALSMLMATSVPLKEEASGHYYSLLNQGSGLANLEAAVTAKSFIRMSENDGTLTAILGMAADGKVKAEVGDDPTRSGEFTYTFTITNFSDETVTYALNTDLFTQKIETKNDVDLLAHQTTAIEGVTTYVINVDVDQHDVNKDGITDGDDVQAILDYLTKKVSGDDLDLEAAELDGKTGISTRDAYALLAFIKATAANAPGADSFTLEPGKTATVQVNIAIPANGELGKRENGGYVEGFTFITSNTDVTYSIPVLGYYGSWTDPSMFDAVTYVEKLYGSEQTSYFLAANASTNGLRIKNSSTESDRFVTGNPYVIEDKFPEDRLAISNNGTIVSAQYT
ncbi:MAG: S8 family serine peptidase, partial [Erysipelotrichaceae bacterium]|nr:S8 family serine peptidase [Erysipelotrichaceae bacterium]